MDKLEMAIAALTVKSVMLGIIVRNLSIVEDDGIPAVACTDGVRILVRPELWSMDVPDIVFVLAHEASHVVFMHSRRRGARNPVLWNIAADCVANHFLMESGFRVPRYAVKPSDVARAAGVKVEVVEEMTAEEVYRLLERISGAESLRSPEGTVGGGQEDVLPPGRGSGRAVRVGRASSEREVSRLVARAVAYAKSIGSIPAGALRMVCKVLAPRVDWRGLLREAVRDGVRRAYRTWMRPSRRGEGLPAYRMEGRCDVYVLIDTSGSICEEELEQFAGEVYAIARHARVYVIPWDAEPHGVHEAPSRGRLIEVFRRHLKGGGGTVLAPALELCLNHMSSRRAGAVVVLTDGLWSDRDERIGELLMRAAGMGARPVVATTVRVPRLPPAVAVIKIDF